MGLFDHMPWGKNWIRQIVSPRYRDYLRYVSSLTRIRREVELLMNERGKWVDIERKLASYQRVWHNFVDTHDKYTHLIDDELECELAFDVYEVQMHKSFELEAIVKSWSDEVNGKRKLIWYLRRTVVQFEAKCQVVVPNCRLYRKREKHWRVLSLGLSKSKNSTK